MSNFLGVGSVLQVWNWNLELSVFENSLTVPATAEYTQGRKTAVLK